MQKIESVKVRVKADEFRKIIARKNLTLDSLSAKIGMSKSFLSQIANANRFPSSRTRAKLMRALKSDWSELFEFAGGAE